MKQRMLLACLMLFVMAAGTVAGISVSPPRIELENMPKNFTLEKTVRLAGIQAGNEIRVSWSGEGSEWVSSPLGSSFPFPEEDELIFPFVISLPEKAPNGEYAVRAHIVASEPEKAEGANSAAISSGVFIDIVFTISGEERKDYHILNVRIPDIELGSKLPVAVSIKNNGNVIAKPEQIEIAIKEKKNKDLITTAVTQQITGVEPYTVSDSVATFDIALPSDFYFADIAIHKESGIEESKDIPFEVFEKGALASSGALLDLNVQDNVATLAKISARFQNTGSLDFYGVLEGEVYWEGTLIDTFQTEQVYVPQKSEVEFTHLYTTSDPGLYELDTAVSFLGKKSNSMKTSFTATHLVPESPPSPVLTLSENTKMIVVLIIIIVFLLGVVIYLQLKTRKQSPKIEKRDPINIIK